jgi:hypothetical protein
MKNFDAQHDFKKQVEMYFDQALDAQSQQDLLQKVNTDPTYQQVFEHEKNIRNQIKQRIYRPVNSNQLIQAIKNQIHSKE